MALRSSPRRFCLSAPWSLPPPARARSVPTISAPEPLGVDSAQLAKKARDSDQQCRRAPLGRGFRSGPAELLRAECGGQGQHPILPLLSHSSHSVGSAATDRLGNASSPVLIPFQSWMGTYSRPGVLGGPLGSPVSTHCKCWASEGTRPSQRVPGGWVRGDSSWSQLGRGIPAKRRWQGRVTAWAEP